QASPDEWAFQRPSGKGKRDISDPNMLLAVVHSPTEAAAILNRIAEQGEAAENPQPAPDAGSSHFARFLEIFKKFPEGEWIATDRLPVSPNTSPAPADEPTVEAAM